MKYQYVNYLWDDAVASKLDPVERLVYRSNILGSDQRITNTGGGNTSAKILEQDPLTGEKVEVLWVKGSGGDLRTSKRENFASLYQQKLIDMQRLYASEPEKGAKTPAEDKMVGMYTHATFNLNPRASSIDTPLHSFIPFKHVDHMHPNAAISVAAAKNSKRLTGEIYGNEVIWTPWLRPGFELGLELQRICAEHPDAKGVILGQHGLINWANDDKECYELTLYLIEKAANLSRPDTKTKGATPRPLAGRNFRLWRKEHDGKFLRRFFLGCAARSASKSGLSAPFRTTKRFCASLIHRTPRGWRSLARVARIIFCGPRSSRCMSIGIRKRKMSPTLKSKLQAGLEKYRADYADYYNRCKRPGSPAMRDPNPTVTLIPGLGMVAWGKDKSESRVTAEFYNCAVEVMRGSEAIDEYIALPQQEAFDIEYWLLEEAKLRRMPAEKELARQVIAVIGAGSGIGKEVAHRIVKEGAHVVCVDLNKDAAAATAKEITDQYGVGIGVAGTGISNCGPAIGLSGNITDRASVRAMLNDAVLAYGGFDSIAVTAGIFISPDSTGHIPDDKWGLTFAINVTGSYIVADEAAKTWKEQSLPGNLVLTTSANAVVAKKGSLAYDTSKAAANHLTRELAIELSPLVRVNAVAPATVVQGSAMFPRERVIASLAKYKILLQRR